jgi:glycosyltransferase involved in cell wall biosynthesis
MSAIPAFSLVLATVNRTEELARLLRSLEAQTLRDIELIVVDQNEDDRVTALLTSSHGGVRVHHLRSPRGLSRARNHGLRAAGGEIIGFPDDDCWYGPNLLREIKNRFDRSADVDGWTGMTRDAEGRPSASRWSMIPGRLSQRTIWTHAMSPAIFLRRQAVEKIGGFDESLGVGAGTSWGSGEETDFLLRGLASGLHFEYDPTLVVFHPQVAAHLQVTTQDRAGSYGMGFGWILRRHQYPITQVVYHCARPLGGAIAALLGGDAARARFSWLVFLGRIRGYLTATPLP